MNEMNQIIIEGTVAGNPVRRTIPPSDGFSGSDVVTLEVMTEHSSNNDKGANISEKTFFKTDCYGKLAKFASTVKPGRVIRIVGRLKQDRWNSEGEPSFRLAIVAEHIELKPLELQHSLDFSSKESPEKGREK